MNTAAVDTTASGARGSRFGLGIGVLLACSFAVAVSNSMIFAALSDLQDTYGFGGGALGAISAAGFIAALVVQVLVAPLADRGEPKHLVLAGMALAAAGSLLFAVGDNAAVFILARALTGASMGAAGPALRAMAGSLDKARAGERLGRMRGVDMAGYTSGPLFGALLLGPLGLRWTFVVFAGIGVAGFVALMGRQMPRLPRTAASRQPSLTLLRLGSIRAVLLMSLTLWIPVGLYDALWDRYLTDRGATNLMVGTSFLLFTIPFVLFGATAGRLADRYGARRLGLTAIACNIPVVFGYGLMDSAWLIIAVGFVEGLFSAFAAPAIQSLLVRSAPEGRASAAQGLMGSSDLMVAAVVSLVAPIAYTPDNAEWVFGSVAAMMTVTFAVSVIASRRLRSL
jgi:MFS family permease